ncbi:MAG: hypothetical protein RIC19_14185 [Phaeodactylibacter sp.]|uniref:tetratricopeptide repeat protein n=1 Tax=Phaeodactylibacter sp. TaxID=1940289 RepID=UPI0032EB7D99
MKNQYTFEDIEAYLAEEQTEEERRSFEADLEEDVRLQEAVKKHRLAHQLTSAYVAERTRGQVAEVFNAHRRQKSGRVIPMGRWAAAAAAVLVLLVAGYWMISSPQQSAPALVTSYFEPYPDRVTTMGSEADALTEAMAAYNAGRYEEALTLFGALPQGSLQMELLNLYTGTAALQAGQMDLAEQALAQTARSATAYAPAGQWYLALTYLQQEKTALAKPLLEELRQGGAYKQKSAAELLDQLP